MKVVFKIITKDPDGEYTTILMVEREGTIDETASKNFNELTKYKRFMRGIIGWKKSRNERIGFELLGIDPNIDIENINLNDEELNRLGEFAIVLLN